MVSLDVRSRSDDDVAPVDVTEFFDHHLPELVRSRDISPSPERSNWGPVR